MNDYEILDVDGVIVPFSFDWNKIAVSVSGGADSALLAYLLCSFIDDHNLQTEVHIVHNVRMWKTRPWQRFNSQQVESYLRFTFPHITFFRHENFIAPELEYGNIGPNLVDEYGKMVSGDNIQIRAFAEYVCHKNNIDAHYNAVTRNPRLAFFNGMKERDIEPTADNQHLAVMKHMGRWAFHPFRFVEKDWVIKQYYDNQIEELLNLTRSCEGEFEGMDYTTYKQGQEVPVCGECFWCKERAWAIDQQ